MNSATLILVASGIFVAIFALFLFGKKDNKKGEETKAENSSSNAVATTQLNSNVASNGKTVKEKSDKGIARKDIFDFMEFDKIADNMIIQDKGNKYTMVIQCKGINYDLMSEVEQMAVEEGFITFLNTLKYPIQLYVQARAVDLKDSMNIYKNSLGVLQEQYRQADDEYNKVTNDIDASYSQIKEAKLEREKRAHILDYAQDITRYVERISLNKHILQRKFYVVLSYNKSEVTATSEFSKEEIYDICCRELTTRAQSLIGALMSCSVQGSILTSNELAELLYISYNRDDEKLLDIRTALESGFYRLYSTSKDVFEKKEELRQKQIEEAALDRVKEALVQNMRMKQGLTEDELLEEFEDRADREALNIINTADMSEEERQALGDIIASRHVIEAEKRKQARATVRKAKENAKSQKGGKMIADPDEDIVSEPVDENITDNNNEVVDEKTLDTSSVDSIDDGSIV